MLKSLAASQLVYLLSPMPSNYHAINEINTLVYQFLWNGKGDKIKRKILINDYCEGGLKMIDLVSFNKSLKTTWIKKYLNSTNNGKWKVFIDLANVFTGNLNTKDTKKSIKVSDVLIEEILEIWAEVNFEQQLASLEHFQEQNLWHNSLIRIENKPIFFKDWCSKGITKVKHLQKPECNSYLSLKYDLNTAPLRFYGLISAVKALGNSSLKQVNDNKQEYEPLSTKILKSKKVSALVYLSLVRNKGEAPRNSQKKWLMDCSCLSSENLDWSSAYLLALWCTKSTKLIEFHFNFFTDVWQLTIFCSKLS